MVEFHETGEETSNYIKVGNIKRATQNSCQTQAVLLADRTAAFNLLLLLPLLLLLLLLLLPQPLTFLKQTMLPGNTLSQLFCSYNL